MAGLDPAIYAFPERAFRKQAKTVDARHEAGHDELSRQAAVQRPSHSRVFPASVVFKSFTLI
jgi:hypothetical protein